MLEKISLLVYADVSAIMKTVMKSLLMDTALERLRFAYHCALY